MSKATFVEQSVPPPPPAAGRITIYGLNSFMYSIDEFGVITLLSGTVGQTDLDVQKSTAGTLNVGELVYLVGWDVADGVVTAELARADASSTMPALGIISEAATQTATGKVRILGELDGLDTSAWPDGTSVFVSASVAGGLTSTRPTGATDLVQRFGKVAYQHVSAGVLTIANAGRSNALPNLTNGNLWIGDGSNQPVETSAAGLGATVFSDSVFRVQDNGDATKQLAFEVSAIATATTRTLTVPNRSLNLGNYKATLLFSDYTVGTTTTARYLFPSCTRALGLAAQQSPTQCAKVVRISQCSWPSLLRQLVAATRRTASQS